MKYFSSLPLISQPNFNGHSVVATNLLSRNYLLPSLKDNLSLYYSYDLRESDTPENVAYRYYNDVNRFWILLYGNNIIDPQWDWPLTSNVLLAYLINKYSTAAGSTDSNVVLAYIQSTVHHYEKIISTSDTSGTQQQSITIQIDQNTYNNTIQGTTSATLPSGVKVTQTVKTRIVSIYDYENNLNESKRKINIIKDSYVTQMETQFTNLMRK